MSKRKLAKSQVLILASSPRNRENEDSVFVDLFYSDESAPQNLLSLYNALHDTNIQNVFMIHRIKDAMNECIEKGILVEYLKRKGSEVRNMLTIEHYILSKYTK